jgi:hypothetical protein
MNARHPFETKKIMATRVNLDALILRQDFDEIPPQPNPQGKRKETLSVNDLLRGEFFFAALRKPEFQRETSEWSPEKILDLIRSFLSKDLIPAVILWQSQSNLNFVIDGSHRLSALAAWINNDYGDGSITKDIYGVVPEEQIEIGDKIRTLIRKSIGSYEDHKLAATRPDKVTPDILARSRILSTVSLQLQWVEGDSKNAETSFRKINEQGVPINTTEKKILSARRKPIGLASRAIIRSGQGHNYWVGFASTTQDEIRTAAKVVNELLFVPKMKNPVKDLNLPLAGKVFSAQSLPVIWDFIRIVNPVDKNESDDLDGRTTLQFLNNCKSAAQLINSDDVGSMGLHPIVYVYSESGRHKPASFYAITDLILDLQKRDKLEEFTVVREQFEKLLLENDYIVQQIVRRYRGAWASYEPIKNFYLLCIEKLRRKLNAAEVIEEIGQTKDFAFLTKSVVELPTNPDKDFSRAVKSRTYIKTALEGCIKCAICRGYVHGKSISIDHIKDKQDGGGATADNAQITHPYCNSNKKKLLSLLS